jgi:hypothetical protein
MLAQSKTIRLEPLFQRLADASQQQVHPLSVLSAECQEEQRANHAGRED